MGGEVINNNKEGSQIPMVDDLIHEFRKEADDYSADNDIRRNDLSKSKSWRDLKCRDQKKITN